MDSLKFRIVYPYSSKKVHIIKHEKEGFKACYDEYKNSGKYLVNSPIKIINMDTKKIHMLKIKNTNMQHEQIPKNVEIKNFIIITLFQN